MMPNSAMYKYHLGMAYLAGGHQVLAQRALEAALKENPKFVYAASAQASLDQISKRAH